jgi:prepilin-type N-terminal cleavage/methylation domain-containing protein
MSISVDVKGRARAAEAASRGFTLIELMIALAIMAIVLGSLAPAFYGAMRASAVSDQHAIANGIAVAASEQLRSFPYWEVGYTSADYQSSPAGVGYPCTTASANPVVTVTTSPLDIQTQSQAENGVTFSVQRCVYWVDSSIDNQSNNYPLAYKQTVVTVSWTVGRVASKVTQMSDIYPGGEGLYGGAKDNYTPTTNVASGATAPPSSPVWVSYADNSTSPTTEINLVWTEPSTPTPAASYLVDYTTSQYYGGAGSLSLTPGTYTEDPFNTPGTSSSPNIVTVGAGTPYYFEVWAVAADGTKSTSPSTVVSVASANAAATCNMTLFKVNPGTATIGSSDKFSGSTTAFNLSITNSGNGTCSNVTVKYTTQGGTVAAATMTGSGTLSGTAGTTNTKWDTGNDTFTVYQNGTQYVPSGGGLLQQQVDITCTGNC